jgi:aromatic ring hydroxylase
MIVGVGVGLALGAFAEAVGVAVGVGVGVPLRDGVDHSMSSSSDIPDSIALMDRVDVPVDNVVVADDVADVIDVELELTVPVGLG